MKFHSEIGFFRRIFRLDVIPNVLLVSPQKPTAISANSKLRWRWCWNCVKQHPGRLHRRRGRPKQQNDRRSLKFWKPKTCLSKIFKTDQVFDNFWLIFSHLLDDKTVFTDWRTNWPWFCWNFCLKNDKQQVQPFCELNHAICRKLAIFMDWLCFKCKIIKKMLKKHTLLTLITNGQESAGMKSQYTPQATVADSRFPSLSPAFSSSFFEPLALNS